MILQLFEIRRRLDYAYDIRIRVCERLLLVSHQHSVVIAVYSDYDTVEPCILTYRPCTIASVHTVRI